MVGVLWYRHDLLTGVVITAGYSLVFLVGLGGNLLVTMAVLRGDHEMRQSVTNIFLVNLAVADLLVIITCLPFTLVTNIIHRKPLPLPLLLRHVILKLTHLHNLKTEELGQVI